MKYVSLLRGINVGGHRKIRMGDLKSLYESMGLQNVVTYIQSGNVVFDALGNGKVDLKTRIEQAIEGEYGFRVPVEIRTGREIEDVIRNSPFGSVDLMEDGTKVLVAFLSSKPAEAKVSEIQQFVVDPERLVVRGQEAYLYCPNGYGKSKLSSTFLEHKLGTEATTRNWKSVHRIHELSV